MAFLLNKGKNWKPKQTQESGSDDSDSDDDLMSSQPAAKKYKRSVGSPKGNTTSAGKIIDLDMDSDSDSDDNTGIVKSNKSKGSQ